MESTHVRSNRSLVYTLFLLKIELRLLHSTVPTFLVEVVPPSIFDYEIAASANSTSAKNQTRLGQFLAQLSQRPADGPPIDETIEEGGLPLDAISTDQRGIPGVPRSASTGSVNGITPSSSMTNGLGNAAPAGSNGSVNGSNGGSNNAAARSLNPEQDSFAYVEDILESLAYLGKLSFAMDSILQRAPIEMYNLVEATVAEADERNDSVRRSSLRSARLGTSPKMLFSGTFPSQNTTAYSLLVRSSVTSTLFLGDEASSASLVQLNTEILLDFFWTLFSKLDAVLQGFRVLHEVMTRIAARKDFKDPALTNKSGSLMYSLTDIWKPIQSEVGDINSHFHSSIQNMLIPIKIPLTRFRHSCTTILSTSKMGLYRVVTPSRPSMKPCV